MNLKRITAAVTAVLCSAGMFTAFPAMNTTAAEAVGNDFEISYEGWYGNGDGVMLEALDGAGYANSRGMVLSGRQTPEDGAASAKGFYLIGGVAYTYHVQVKSDQDEVFHLSLLTIDEETGEETVKELTSKTVKAGEWTDLSAKYKAPKNSYEFRLNITTESVNDFAFDEVHITSEQPVNIASAATAEKGLKDEFAPYFRVGNILNGGTVRNSAITATFLKDNNAIECENETKPDATLVKNGSTDTDIKVSLNSCAAIADFASKNGLAFRGHTLVWHSQTPQWFFKEGFNDNGNWVSKDVMNKRMESYIKNMFAAFATQYPNLNLYSYDVCNECVSDDANRTANNGGAREPGYGDGKSPWVAVYGDNSFVEQAFTYARKYAPEGCDLYYNDYNEYWDHKRDCIYNMCKSLYQKNLLDGVGMQSHIGAEYDGFTGVSNYVTAMKKYLSIGCDVQITELDISCDNGKYSSADQAKKYTAIFQAAVDWNKNPQSDGRVTLVQIWGPNDANTWIKTENSPLLYDTNNQPKEAYKAVTAMIPQSEWGDGTQAPGNNPKPEYEPNEFGWYFHCGFEDGEDKWVSRGGTTVASSASAHYVGSKALYVSGRTSAWNGANYTLPSGAFKAGEEYSFSAHVMYDQGPETDDIYFSIQYEDASGETQYDKIDTATVPKGQWVQLSNMNYKIPDGATNVVIYVETADSTTSFYVDEVIGAVGGTGIAGEGKPTIRKAVKGDVDGDGVIDVIDLGLAKRGLVKGFTDKTAETCADVDESGTVDVTDVILIDKFLHKLIDKFPVEDKPQPPAPSFDNSKWDSYQETASSQMQEFYQNAILQYGNTSRLWNAVAKAQSGEPTTVAYLGGSITEGDHAPTCYAQRSFNYFADTFSTGSNCTFINAGMSGTSSVVGLMRAQRDILDAKPDVIFIEFSVNDHPEEIYKKSFESLVKKCLSQEQEPAVIIIINRAKGGYSMKEQMAAVGKQYDVPVISMDDALTKAFNSGLLQTGDYYTDEYHPHADGAALISDSIAYFYRQALKTEHQSPAYTIPNGQVYGNEYATGSIVPVSALSGFNAGSFKEDNSNGRFAYGYTFQKGSDNTPMTFKTTGKGIFIVFKSNQNSSLGVLNVTVNGKTTQINGNKLYAWGGADSDLAYMQDASGELNVSISMDNAGNDFTIWGIGVVK